MFLWARTYCAGSILGVRRERGIVVQLLLVDLDLRGTILFVDLLFGPANGLSQIECRLLKPKSCLFVDLKGAPLTSRAGKRLYPMGMLAR